MATNVVKTPVFRAVSRTYTTQKTNAVGGWIADIKSSTLPNKLVVASSETGSPISRLQIVFRAGSRYETSDNQGAAHLVRICAGLSTKCSTNFAITRNIQQVGASLTCVQDRETIAYTLEGTYESLQKSSEFLSDIASQQVFKPWEVSDNLPRVRLELASLSPEVRALNFLHRAAYRTGLGNSLFCAKHNIGKLSSETLQHFVSSNFAASRAAVIGLGIPNDLLIQYAENINLPTTTCEDPKAVYYGGEIRSEKGGELAYVSLAGEGAGITNKKEAYAFAVLRRIVGAGPYVKRGIESSGLLSKALGNNANCVAAAGLNVSYSDSGLFGVFIAGPSGNICEAVKAAAGVLKNMNISDADVKRAKKQLKTGTLLKAESGGRFIDSIGYQAVTLGCPSTPEQICADIDAVNMEEVKKAASKVSSSKWSMASVGNLTNVPYLDELKK